jgi:hypothetical protein
MPLASGAGIGRLFIEPRRRQFAFSQGGVDFGHGGRAIGLALAVEPFLMGTETGDPRLISDWKSSRRSGRARGTGLGISRAVFPNTSTVGSTVGVELPLAPGAQVAFPPAETQFWKRLRRKGLRPDGWFRMFRRRARQTDALNVFSASGVLPVTD